MRKSLIALLSAGFLLAACSGGGKAPVRPDAEKPVYATLFSVTAEEGYRLLDVLNPWDSTRLLHRYVLVGKGDPLPDPLPEGTLVRTPVEEVVVSSSIDVGTFEQLGALEKVFGCFEAEYLTKPSHLDRIGRGYIQNLGSARKTTAEPLLILGPEVIFAAPFKGEGYGALEKTGIPIAEVASYLETTPLGRCEWIKFYAEFIDKRPTADSLFAAVEKRYLDIKDRVSQTKARPKLLVEKRFGQVWYVPAGGSYAVNLYRDAGAAYPWSDSGGTGSLSLSFEEVYAKAHDADVWLFRYFDPAGEATYRTLAAEYPQYASFRPFREKEIYVCNTAETDYYGTVVLQPDAELRDLAKIFHPELFPDEPFVYYKKLKTDETE